MLVILRSFGRSASLKKDGAPNESYAPAIHLICIPFTQITYQARALHSPAYEHDFRRDSWSTYRFLSGSSPSDMFLGTPLRPAQR